MKRNYLLIISILVSFFGIYSCSNSIEEELELQKSELTLFLESNTFLRHQTNIGNFGEIDYSKVLYEKINTGNENDDAGYLIIPLLKDNSKVGYLEVVDLKTTDCLPNGDRYAINYVNLAKFDQSSLSGVITMIDLNYENYLHSVITVENNNILRWENEGLSDNLRIKYGSNNSPQKLRLARAGVSCDPNRDNNVSFSECYNCVKDATQIDTGGPISGQWICDFPFFGQVGCWVSITAACIYISGVY